MKDIGSTIRTVYTSLLAVTYNGQSVPFYSGEPYETTPENYIYINSIDQAQDNNDQRYANEVVVTLDVVTKTNMANDKTAVDSISNSVLTAVVGQIVDTVDFQVHIINATSNYLHQQDGTIHINRKLIRIFNRITQK
jgi:hypothetical protein